MQLITSIKNNLIHNIALALHNRFKDKAPDFVVGDNYLKRWWVIPRNPFFNVYYHNFKVSDDDRATHDHSYINLSILLKGEYFEHVAYYDDIDTLQIFHRKAGDFKFRLPKTLHRIEIPKNSECWTLFITGPRVRDWGFQVGPIVRNWLGFKTKSGWMFHEDYINKYGEQNGNDR